MARYIMALDAKKCMNCKACVVACQQRNAVPYGQHRNWVRENVAPSTVSGWTYQPGGCMQCDAPQCVDACPTHATYKGDDGVVYVDKNRCIGCGSCIKACPYDARYKDPTFGVVDKCDYCLSSRANGQVPACVHACATKVRVFGDANDPNSDVSKVIKQAQLTYVKAPNTDTKPTLAYIGETSPTNWPKDTEIPTAVALMGPVATGIRWLGGLSLFGVLAVFVKNMVAPPYDDTDHS